MRKPQKYTVNFAFYEPPPPPRACDCHGCTGAGEYPAPKSRYALREFYWFCLEHVRDYNANWDYYADMTMEEIEAAVKDDVTWNRPTWKAGGKSFTIDREAIFRKKDAFFDFTDYTQTYRAKKGVDAAYAMNVEIRQALQMLELDVTVLITFTQIKQQYRTLAKRYHPDREHSVLTDEDKLKKINEAYAVVKKYRTLFAD
jgi:hypothetical protein